MDEAERWMEGDAMRNPAFFDCFYLPSKSLLLRSLAHQLSHSPPDTHHLLVRQMDGKEVP